MMQAMEFDQNNFTQEVLQSAKPVLVDFFAVWCAPCKMVSPLIEEIAAERDDIKTGKVDVDQNMALAQQYQVMSIPTLILFRDGKPVNRIVGAVPKEEILAML